MEKLIKWCIMFFFSITSTLLLPSIYFIKSSYWMILADTNRGIWLNIMLYLLIPVILSFVFILFFKKVSAKDSIENEVKSIEPVNNEYIPIYLGYIFISVSIPNPCAGEVDWITLGIIYFLINLIITQSRSLCFNPLFILFGYGYYAIITGSNVKLYIITRRKVGKRSSKLTFPNIRKITEIVYFEE